ncbi:unnamed protein product [Phytophthora lilii]|uniref:Unnamed protein product n=1 Tax=Phytophthora lilii TaxID=2077276 RepID=A0A9W6YJ79_9STRA|nr:unnamed protein product [Phytophthora lilii]
MPTPTERLRYSVRSSFGRGLTTRAGRLSPGHELYTWTIKAFTRLALMLACCRTGRRARVALVVCAHFCICFQVSSTFRKRDTRHNVNVCSSRPLKMTSSTQYDGGGNGVMQAAHPPVFKFLRPPKLTEWSQDALVKWKKESEQYEDSIRQRYVEGGEHPEVAYGQTDD